jgi:hypothetical protein
MAIEQGRLTPQLCEAMLSSLLENVDSARKGQREGWANPLWRKARATELASKQGLAAFDIYWEPRADGPVGMEMMLTYHFESRNRDALKVGAMEVLTIWVWDAQLSGKNEMRFGDPLETFKRIMNLVQPTFAAVDDYSKSVKKRKGEDLREYSWGATVYGPEAVKAIGLAKLRLAPGWRVEELPWGGVWVQAGENPFNVDFRAKHAIEKHLGLKELFGESVPATAKPRKPN